MLTHVVQVGRLATFAYIIFCTIQLSFAISHPLEIEDGSDPINEQAEIFNYRVKKARGFDMVQLDTERTQVPVIGVITQVLRDYKRFTNTHHLHLPSSYVKWIESAGAQVLPILLNQNDTYYENIFKQTNGLLLPGGDNLLDPRKNTPMLLAARKLYKLAVEANDRGDFYPIWGTCLGMELLTVLSSNTNWLESCNATDETLTMNFVDRGKLFEPNHNSNLKVLNDLDYPKFIINTLSKLPTTFNYHKKCVTDTTLARANLQHFYKPLAYSHDPNGIKFIAIFEAYSYPFFGVQFHPEKPAFEVHSEPSYRNVPHSRESIEVSRYFADFFIRQAQRSAHRARDLKEQMKLLIYNYQPMYTALLDDVYEQRYLFPFSDANNYKTEKEILREAPQGSVVRVKGKFQLPPSVSPIKNPHLNIEFLEYIPGPNESAPEDIEDAARIATTELPRPVAEFKDIELNVYESSVAPIEDKPDRIVLPRESAKNKAPKSGRSWG